MLRQALTHAAAVSRFFWPPRGKGTVAQHRAAKLRETFGVTDESPLFARDPRNILEHFDERLDEYLLRDLAGFFFPGPMVGSAEMADEEIGHLFRLVDPETETFVLFGKKYPFGPLREAVAIIYHVARGSADHGGRLPMSETPLT